MLSHMCRLTAASAHTGRYPAPAKRWDLSRCDCSETTERREERAAIINAAARRDFTGILIGGYSLSKRKISRGAPRRTSAYIRRLGNIGAR
jgi:hypothetical protein